jgi:carboxyl-terminal processing protease
MFKRKILPFSLIILSIAALVGSGFYWGLQTGRQTPDVVLAKGVANIGDQTPADFRTFWDAWQAIDDNYLRAEKVNGQTRVYGAIKGLVDSLGDPYTQFFTPDQGKKFEEDVQGNFGGIGAELGIRKDILTVIAPLKNSPAAAAGIKAGDLIFKVGATSTDGLSIDQAVHFIRGPENTKVTLNIFREGWDKAKDFTLTRKIIEVPTLDFEMKGPYAYVALHSFNNNASKEFYNAIKQAADKNAQGLILDLRDDPGGFLEVAVDLAGWFLKPGTIVVSEEDKTGPIQTLKANGSAALVDFPTVVLINKGSASAAEILAGALRDQRKIKLVGETSFGKGTVQQLKTLRDGSEMKITIAHWVMPSGAILENGGIKPNYEVQISDDDIKNKKDPQLDRAIEVLKAEIK